MLHERSMQGVGAGGCAPSHAERKAEDNLWFIGHSSIVDTCDIMDNFECPDHISIFKPPQQRTLLYSLKWTQILVLFKPVQ